MFLDPVQVWEGSASGSAFGIGLSVASVVCGAAMLSFSGRALSEKLDVFRCGHGSGWVWFG